MFKFRLPVPVFLAAGSMSLLSNSAFLVVYPARPPARVAAAVEIVAWAVTRLVWVALPVRDSTTSPAPPRNRPARRRSSRAC